MATYEELSALFDNRLRWAASAIANPQHEAKRFLRAVIAKNESATVEQITGATDAKIQTETEEFIDAMAFALFQGGV